MRFDERTKIKSWVKPMPIEEMDKKAQEFLQGRAGQSPTYRQSHSRPQSRYISEYERDSGKEEDDGDSVEKEVEEEVKEGEGPQQSFE